MSLTDLSLKELEDKFFILAVIVLIFVYAIGFASGHQELRNDMPVVPQALTFCFMRYDSTDGVKEPYLECNVVEGFTQEQLRGMREHLEEYADK